ncbi:thiol-disulfide oxidoreductase DCC family protein [Collimonas sp.]|jgi:predicted DCC family thiol-disulfide oxidoreductase YuxK|uniref:thiol-disulfide oxidoreductase DCC family protein n=1 Tax=Collimonas sp. TaxID=1963772 RepID=UPI0037C00516
MTTLKPDCDSPALTILYDGACPLCSREIALYQRAQASVPLCFADISEADATLPPGATRDQLLQRFHVRSPDGQLHSGAEAFVMLWAALPAWRWLARTAKLPGAMWLMERSYCLFLRGRPALQRWAARWDRSDS